MSGDQKLRGFLYHLSLTVFFVGLPFILTVTLGYKFDPVNLKLTRTGLISLKSQPAGAGVWLNGKPLKEKTPCSVNELLPGKYSLELRLPGHYPYAVQAEVRESSVTRLEKILLFPLRPDVQKLNREDIDCFWIEKDNFIYYAGSGCLYRSDLEGERFEKVADFIPLRTAARGWKLSPDRKRVLYFNDRQVGVVELSPDPGKPPCLVIDLISAGVLRQAFWYSDSYNLLILAGSELCMLEARANARPFTLLKLNSERAAIEYDSDKETVYFQDSQAGADNNDYENVYKLELRRKLYPFGDLIWLKKND